MYIFSFLRRLVLSNIKALLQNNIIKYSCRKTIRNFLNVIQKLKIGFLQLVSYTKEYVIIMFYITSALVSTFFLLIFMVNRKIVAFPAIQLLLEIHDFFYLFSASCHNFCNILYFNRNMFMML